MLKRVTKKPQIKLTNYVMDAMIGIYDFEREAAQRIRVNIKLDLCQADRNTNTQTLRDIVHNVVFSGHTNLVETLAEDIANQCLDNANSDTVRVRVEKLDIIKDAASVGIEIERCAHLKNHPVNIRSLDTPSLKH